MELILAVILGAVALGLVRSVLRAGVLAKVEAERATAVTAAAFRLQGARWCEFEIVGESVHQSALAAIAGSHTEGVNHHCEAFLIPQPDNPHDPNAVMVAIDGRPVGHLARGDAYEYTERLAELGAAGRAASCPAYICGGFINESGRRAPYGVKLGLAWPAALETAQHGPQVAAVALARLRRAPLSEEEAWHTPPVPVADDLELAEAFADGVQGREIAFVGWSEERLPYLRAVSRAMGLQVADGPTPELALVCVGPRALDRDVAIARSRGVAIISGEQLQGLIS